MAVDAALWHLGTSRLERTFHLQHSKNKKCTTCSIWEADLVLLGGTSVMHERIERQHYWISEHGRPGLRLASAQLSIHT